MSTYTLSIVLPCYNPSQGWESNVLEEYRLLKAALPSEQIQLIVVNDGSTINVSQESTFFSQLKVCVHSARCQLREGFHPSGRGAKSICG
jgi:glycosyltransferase involved in cell wall biosynthesis